MLSGWQDSNLRPPAPKAGAMTGLRYTPLSVFHSKDHSLWQLIRSATFPQKAGRDDRVEFIPPFGGATPRKRIIKVLRFATANIGIFNASSRIKHQILNFAYQAYSKNI